VLTHRHLRETHVQLIGNEIDEIQASLLRALASPHRLRIVHRLGTGTCEVNELARDLGLAQSSVSQHLAAMRAVGLVDATRDGRSVRYQLTDPEILGACDVMRTVIVRRLSALGDLAAAAAAPSPTPMPTPATRAARAAEPQVTSR
jgi:DNA-binding transcriptional ArsR family regulator